MPPVGAYHVLKDMETTHKPEDNEYKGYGLLPKDIPNAQYGDGHVRQTERRKFPIHKNHYKKIANKDYDSS